MKKLFFLALYSLFFVLFFTLSAHAATYTVSPGENVAAAVEQLRAGDTLYFRQGTYNQGVDDTQMTIPSGTDWNNPVTIASYPGETATLPIVSIRNQVISYVVFDRLTVDNGHLQFAFQSHLRFSNGEIRNFNSTLVEAGQGGDIQIINNKIHDTIVSYDPSPWPQCGNQGCTHGAYCFYFNAHDSLIEGNEIYNCAGYGIHMYWGGGTTIFNNIIRNNVFYNDYYDDGQRNSDGATLLVSQGGNTQIYNNIIYNATNARHQSAIVTQNSAAPDKIYNNTIYNVAKLGIYAYPGARGADIRNNIIYQTGEVAILDEGSGTTHANNYTSDPKFVNAPSDFHLKPGSPALTASDSGGEVGAYGNGGHPGTEGRTTQTPTPSPTPQGTLCSSLTLGTTIGTGFGTPWNPFNLSEMLLKAYCSGQTTTAVLGPSTYIYNQGYGWTGSTWTQTTFTCTGGTLVSGAWCPTTAQGTLPQSSTYYVGYTCNWTGSKWNCGCADTQCSQNFWQLQKIN